MLSSHLHLSVPRQIQDITGSLTDLCSSNRPFPSSPWPLYQNKVKCSAFDVGMIFYSHANKTPFHKKGCALGLILKVRVFRTRKWPITFLLLMILQKFGYSSQKLVKVSAIFVDHADSKCFTSSYSFYFFCL